MKIIETIEGATENTVVYEDASGRRIAVTRPKIVSVERILAEIEASSDGSVKTEERKTVRTGTSAVPEITPDRNPPPNPQRQKKRTLNTEGNEDDPEGKSAVDL